MLLWLEDKGLRYPVKNINVAGEAYADDIVLTVSSHYDMQTMFSMVVVYTKSIKLCIPATMKIESQK